MKNNIKKELHNKSILELRAQLKEAKEAKRVLNLDHQMGKLKNTSAINLKRVEIAVMSTIINEKLAEEKLEQVVKADDASAGSGQASSAQGKKEVLTKEKSASKKTASVPANAKAAADKKTSAVKGGKK
ncbi:MAG TPA: 50S ribosomal protein L29 [Xanthomonadales bacterium]|nr:50S ribosomal protein L29 [Xanthomonadales bacterium]